MASGIALVVLVMSQTTKSEGLTGTIGGKMSSNFARGKPGKDERLANWTKWAAVTFFVSAMVSYVLMKPLTGI